MTDELDKLKQVFRMEAPARSRAAAREAAIAGASAKFTEVSRYRQGSGVLIRLMDRIKDLIGGRPKMYALNLNQMLMAGTSLAVIALAVVASSRVLVLDYMATAPSGTETATAPEAQMTPSGGQILVKPNTGTKGTEAPTEMTEAVPQQLPAPSPNPTFDAFLPTSPDTAYDMAEKSPSGISGYDAIPSTSYSGGIVAEPDAVPQQRYHDQGRDKFTDIVSNPIRVAAEEPVSTFSIDTDTASYSFVRSSLAQNTLPQKDAVRVEELVNYFPYDYPQPADRAEPFRATVTMMPTPWNLDTKLVHIGIKGFSLNGQERPRSNLVFLIDTSGSMDEPNKLPLLVNSMKLLVDTLQPDDTVAIVVYAGNAGTVLEPTKIKDRGKITSALDNLAAAGSTAGAEGIRQAYNLAEQNFDKTGINRVILATDGDFNVGITDTGELKSFVERKRETGIYLSVLGFGQGNYNDELMQVLAQNGNGNAAYIDTLNEARKVLVDEATSTLFPIAQDVKIQVEFNPQTVSEYRLIGYETRLLNREDFNNDKVDAGEVGSGHTVTALYEVTPKGSPGQLVDPLRYGAAADGGNGDEYAFVKIRYKLPGEAESKLITEPVTAANEQQSAEASFAAAVAGFGQLLRGGQYTRSFTYDDVITLALAHRGKDEFGYRSEFVNLVRLAKSAQSLEPLQ